MDPRYAATIGLFGVVLGSGCAGDRPAADAAPPADTATADTAGDAEVDAAICPPATQALELARVCVVGAEPPPPEDAGEPGGDEDAGAPPAKVRLVAGEPARFVIYPKGCYSARCTKVHEARCEVGATGDAFSLTGVICVGPDRKAPCSTDCEGGGEASCQSGEPLAAGSYTVTLGGLSVDFTVPSEVEPLELCAGDRYP